MTKRDDPNITARLAHGGFIRPVQPLPKRQRGWRARLRRALRLSREHAARPTLWDDERGELDVVIVAAWLAMLGFCLTCWAAIAWLVTT